LEEYKLTDRLNSPAQGTGADILKKAMVLLRPRIAGKAKIVHIVHDEIILEAPEEKAEEMKKILEDAMKEAGQYYIKSVPVEVEGNICDSWAEK
jgi:DNA polymerase I-like protein with 3'-5' exonuclease and polymerase domains